MAVFDHLSDHIKKIHMRAGDKKTIWVVITGIIVITIIIVITLRPRVNKEEGDIISKVGQLMLLPTDEQPTIANVTNVEKLKAQPFFKNAQNGDKVLVYSKNKKAILYRPFTNKIIEVSNISTEGSAGIALQQSALKIQPTGTALDTIKVAIYTKDENRTLSNQIEKEIQDRFPKIKVVDKSTTQSSSYTKTLVIDLGGNNKDLVGSLARMLGGEVVASAEGEIKPIADILIIAVK